MIEQFQGQDKRQSIRIPVDVDLYYRAKTPADIRIRLGEEKQQGAMFDVSVGGLGFVSESEIPLTTELEIKFHLIFKGDKGVSLDAAGRVRYCQPLPEFNTFRVGVEFTRIADFDKKLISEFVRTSLTEN